MKRVGLYFGSYNPVHSGHLALANEMIERGIVDEVWFVVSPQNPFKKQNDLLDQELRLEMLNLAIAPYPKLKSMDIEFRLPRPSYTINTLRVLSTQYPDIEFFILQGSDNALNMEKWKDYQEIVNNYPILIYPRRGYDIAVLKNRFPKMQLLDTPYYDISSTEIRQKIEKGEEVSEYLSAPVYNYIKRNHLYQKTMKELTQTMTVKEKDSAQNYGSGTLDVLSTPALVGFMENTAMNLMSDLPKEETSVGTSIAVQHLKASPMGEIIRCTARLTAVEGRKYSFELEAYDSKDELIGKGEHTRFAVNTERFMSKLG